MYCMMTCIIMLHACMQEHGRRYLSGPITQRQTDDIWMELFWKRDYNGMCMAPLLNLGLWECQIPITFSWKLAICCRNVRENKIWNQNLNKINISGPKLQFKLLAMVFSLTCISKWALYRNQNVQGRKNALVALLFNVSIPSFEPNTIIFLRIKCENFI